MNNFNGLLGELVMAGVRGTKNDIDTLMGYLNSDSTLAITRYVDYALSLVACEDGVDRIEYYLFHGTLIQRNYACLFFGRLGEWEIVKKAYHQGLIDEVQAFAR